MLWDSEYLEGQTHAKMIASFTDVLDETGAHPERYMTDPYCIVLKNRLQFFLAIDFLPAGCSFHQVSRVLYHRKQCSEVTSINLCVNVTISKYALYACTVILQKVYELLGKAWTFSVALDMSTHMITLYLDLRIHLHLLELGIINLHVLPIPV